MKKKLYFIGPEDGFGDYNDYDSDLDLNINNDIHDDYNSDTELDDNDCDDYNDKHFYNDNPYGNIDRNDENEYNETRKDIWSNMDWDKD